MYCKYPDIVLCVIVHSDLMMRKNDNAVLREAFTEAVCEHGSPGAGLQSLVDNISEYLIMQLTF